MNRVSSAHLWRRALLMLVYTLLQLSVTIDRREGSAVFDFEGTGPEVHGNTNAPPAVTYSAIIYSLRCMVDQDIPLNQVGPAFYSAAAHQRLIAEIVCRPARM